ncbi:MAG: FecR domain-containing protein [Gammaproteobacteria bacterium]|nr:FecR domain-containing protein [Gammaproteobacteria bacterium]
MFRTSRRITREATAAAVRTYNEDIKDSERRAILARCEEDPVFKARYMEAHELLGALDDWRDELREDSMYRTLSGKPRARRRSLRNAAAFGVAASVVLVAVVLTSIGLFTQPGSTVTRYTTAVGEQRSVTLPDGSTITLNTGSQILAGITDTVRRVVMDRGEAYFEVAKDPLRPFTVEVGGRSITAHGTAFNVRRLGGSFTVALVDGRVALHRQGGEPPAAPQWLDLGAHPGGFESPLVEELGLRSGTVLHFDAHSQTITARHDPEIGRRQQWRQGRLSFKDQPLSTVVAELSRYSTKPIRIHDADVADIRVFATLRLDSIDTALSTLERAVPIRVVPTLSGIAVLAEDHEPDTP